MMSVFALVCVALQASFGTTCSQSPKTDLLAIFHALARPSKRKLLGMHENVHYFVDVG